MSKSCVPQAGFTLGLSHCAQPVSPEVVPLCSQHRPSAQPGGIVNLFEHACSSALPGGCLACFLPCVFLCQILHYYPRRLPSAPTAGGQLLEMPALSRSVTRTDPWLLSSPSRRSRQRDTVGSRQ